MTIITLTTDFGTADGFVGIMKGVILTIAPEARLVDLTHEIDPQNVRQAAFVLERAAPYFPPGSVHLAVVDPGVGGPRRALVVATLGGYFVGPDNGLLSAALGQPGSRAYELDRPEYWLPRVSQTFHGRDVFAPVAAHLAAGLVPEDLGSPVDHPVSLALPAPQQLSGGEVHGEIIYVDHFGNLISNIPGPWLAGRAWRCQIAAITVETLSVSYAEVAPGSPVALVSSGGTLEIAVRNGNAAALAGVGAGAAVTLTPITR